MKQKQSPQVFCKKIFNFIKKETPTKVFSCEFCEIIKNILFYRTPPVADSDESNQGCEF